MLAADLKDPAKLLQRQCLIASLMPDDFELNEVGREVIALGQPMPQRDSQVAAGS